MRRIGVLEKLGREITPAMVQGTIALYAGGALRPTPELCTVERNLAYGPDERQRLDVFLPSSGNSNRPARAVLMFVHGGGFVAGDKGAPEAPFYNNIGAWAALHGLIGRDHDLSVGPGVRVAVGQ